MSDSPRKTTPDCPLRISGRILPLDSHHNWQSYTVECSYSGAISNWFWANWFFKLRLHSHAEISPRTHVGHFLKRFLPESISVELFSGLSQEFLIRAPGALTQNRHRTILVILGETSQCQLWHSSRSLYIRRVCFKHIPCTQDWVRNKIENGCLYMFCIVALDDPSNCKMNADNLLIASFWLWVEAWQHGSKKLSWCNSCAYSFWANEYSSQKEEKPWHNKFEDAKKWLEGDFRGDGQSDSKVTKPVGKVTFEWILSSLWVTLAGAPDVTFFVECPFLEFYEASQSIWGEFLVTALELFEHCW